MRKLPRAALALTVPFAMSVSALHAQTPGSSFEGSGEIPRGISTITLPDDVQPRGLPMVSDLSKLEEIGREIVGEDTLRSRFGSVSLSADGTVTESEASEGVMRAIMGDQASAPDPAFDNIETPRFVGPDNRRQITDPSSFPVTAIGLLYSVYGESGGHCSAALIGPATVVTAAHCIYDHELGWPDNILYVPAMMDEDTYPYGVFEFETADILPAYLSEYDGEYATVIPYDLAVISLKEPVGDELGWLGFRVTDDIQGFSATVLGYPGDKPFGTMWESSCEIRFQEGLATDEIFVHFCAVTPGSSGSSMYAYFPLNNERFVKGINVAGVEGDQGFNVAVRINAAYFQWIIERWK